MRVVLDTNVIYAALRSGTGASNALLRQIGTGKFEFYLSVALVLEYESVLKRQGQASHYTLADVEALISYLCATGKAQTIHFLWRPQLRDPKSVFMKPLAWVQAV
ncbi:putative toxin-antitoxin system toxin component, PIN family [Deinococcus antarcticus]|uniref:Toxin-antitoxin system toxin component, PIN family n=1 Tax=Deinococcus antarcticus TaxID=1298767 RepID=A0ABV8AAP5_9DEIO